MRGSRTPIFDWLVPHVATHPASLWAKFRFREDVHTTCHRAGGRVGASKSALEGER